MSAEEIRLSHHEKHARNLDESADGAYVAALWEHPTLCLAVFGVQFHSEAGESLYQESGLSEEVFAALESMKSDGLLLNRPLLTDEGPVLMQYWRSYNDLERWARKLPHTRWWQWLVENAGSGLSFHHEIYQVKTGEAIYERGARAVGPALFCSVHDVRGVEGHARERLARFVAAAAESAPTR